MPWLHRRSGSQRRAACFQPHEPWGHPASALLPDQTLQARNQHQAESGTALVLGLRGFRPEQALPVRRNVVFFHLPGPADPCERFPVDWFREHSCWSIREKRQERFWHRSCESPEFRHAQCQPVWHQPKAYPVHTHPQHIFPRHSPWTKRQSGEKNIPQPEFHLSSFTSHC